MLGRSREHADAPGPREHTPCVQWDLVALGNGAVNTVAGRQEVRKDVGMMAICTLLWFISFAAEAGPPVGFRTGGSDIMKKRWQKQTTLTRREETMAYLCAPLRQLCAPVPLGGMREGKGWMTGG